uniref:Uncharacterized protein n=1 Tax=Oryza punctata TaxID=4537 RepID=A0A0E0KQ87_ORYPU
MRAHEAPVTVRLWWWWTGGTGTWRWGGAVARGPPAAAGRARHARHGTARRYHEPTSVLVPHRVTFTRQPATGHRCLASRPPAAAVMSSSLRSNFRRPVIIGGSHVAAAGLCAADAAGHARAVKLGQNRNRNQNRGPGNRGFFDALSVPCPQEVHSQTQQPLPLYCLVLDELKPTISSLSYSSALQLNPSPAAGAAEVLLPAPVMPVLDPGKQPLWSPNCRQPLVLT